MPADMPSDPAPTAVAARAATLMAYVVGIVGAGAATLALRSGAVVDATLVLTVSLGVAALLAATGTLLRSLERIEQRLRRIEGDRGSASR
jgi:hypothetical protein